MIGVFVRRCDGCGRVIEPGDELFVVERVRGGMLCVTDLCEDCYEFPGRRVTRVIHRHGGTYTVYVYGRTEDV